MLPHPAALAAATLGPSWLDPQSILDRLGPFALWGALIMVFAETGLLVGFFLPGDSLLFTVGLLGARGNLHQPLWLAVVLLVCVAVLGNVVGYEIGRRAGPAIFRREESRLFKHSYVIKTHEFFERYGNRAILLGRFVPIVRTFITVTAGVGQMERRRYLAWSTFGGVLWAGGVTILGYFLGSISFVSKNIEAMLVLIVLISFIPIAVEYLRARGRRAPPAEPVSPRSAAGSDQS